MPPNSTDKHLPIVRRVLVGAAVAVVTSACVLPLPGCKAPEVHRREADEAAARIIEEKQRQALGRTEPLTIERPADTLRRRLMLDQRLQHSSAASLSTKDIEPIERFPDPAYLDPARGTPDPTAARYAGGTLRLGLAEALQVAAYNSSEYQNRKEQVFVSALALDLERDDFRTAFFAAANNRASADLGGDDLVAGITSSPELGVTQRLANGALLSGAIALDLVRLLHPGEAFSVGVVGDLSVTVPLLRGAGPDVVLEPLTQAERNVVYQLWSFEQFKRSFVVNVANAYLGVVQAIDDVETTEKSYRRLIANAQRSRRLADAGRLPEIQVDQAVQEELRGRERWISARLGYARQLDNFKRLLGLPPDAALELDRAELTRLAESVDRMLGVTSETGKGQDAEAGRPATQPAATQPATLPVSPSPDLPASTAPATSPAGGGDLTGPSPDDIVLDEPDPVGGPYEIPEHLAIRIALENRPDLKVAQGAVADAQRQVRIAADALRAGLSVTGAATIGEGRSLGSAGSPNAQLRPERGAYSGGVLLDLPLERTAERNNYRRSLIQLEQAVRAVQTLEDDIKLAVRSRLRDLLAAREALHTQAKAYAVAQRRVHSTDLFLLAGRAAVRDVLESQNALVQAQIALTGALVDYRIAELELQRDLGVLEVNHEGLWREYVPPAERPTTLPAMSPIPASQPAAGAGAGAGAATMPALPMPTTRPALER